MIGYVGKTAKFGWSSWYGLAGVLVCLDGEVYI